MTELDAANTTSLHYRVGTMAKTNAEYAGEAGERHDRHSRAMNTEKRKHREALAAPDAFIRRADRGRQGVTRRSRGPGFCPVAVSSPR